jgi:N-acetylglucosaminyldiphosphoundecaprenol N-acetyl-beta-D-mannosaminyltransferase
MTERYPTINILGLNVLAMKKDEILAEIIHNIKSKKRSYACLPNVYSAVLFQKNEEFRNAMLAANFLIPDGLPLVWVSLIKGKKIDRIRGSDLMLILCHRSSKNGLSHFFYGGEPGIPEKLAAELKKKFPWLNVAGMYSPPFRPLTTEEDKEIVRKVNEANPDILWVGLGNPKQEIWMYDHRKMLNVPMIIGVGAAFDFLSGNVKHAPKWMQDSGLEWLFRLVHEPRKLWKRYFLGNTMFLILVALDLLKAKGKRHDHF